MEIYPSSNGTSIYNTRYTVNIIDNGDSNGGIETNYYGVGGTSNFN